MIIFIYGEDLFRSRSRLVEFKKKFFEKYGPQADYSTIDAEGDRDLRIKDLVETGSLFSSTKLIVIKSFIQNGSGEGQQHLVDFFNSRKEILSEKNTVIVFWENGVPEKKNILVKYFGNNARCESFEKLGGLKLAGWINAQIKEINPAVKLSRAAIENLTAYTAGESELINNELLKLANYKNKGEISDQDVDCLVSAKLSSDIFITIEAAVNGNKKAAVSLLHRQLENKTDPFYVLLMYLYQFRSLLKVGEFYWQGEGNKDNISKKTGIHPYVVQKSLVQLKNLSLYKLRSAYLRLGRIDLEAKTGKINLGLALDQFLIEM